MIIPLGHKFLPHVQREEEGSTSFVSHPITIVVWCPGVVGVAADGLAELGADKHQGVLFVVTSLMEGSYTEIVLWGSKQPFHPLQFIWFVEKRIEYLGMALAHFEYPGVKNIWNSEFCA